MDSYLYPDTLNERFERLQRVNDITLNLDYWDCECENNYIHPICMERCNNCGYTQDECPSSRDNEVGDYWVKGLLFECCRISKLKEALEKDKIAREEAQFGDDLLFSDVEKLNALEKENRKLKEVVIKQAFENNALQQLLSQTR